MRLFVFVWTIYFSFSLVQGQDLFPFPEEIEIIEQGVYLLPEPHEIAQGKVVLLQMAYAQDDVLNSEDLERVLWDQVYEVNLVFTKYPADTSKWRTNYQDLMNGRLASLHGLNADIFQKEEMKWRYILQTDCKTEPEAMQYYHGFVLRLSPGRPLTEEEKQQELVEEVPAAPPERVRPVYVEPSDSLPDFLESHPEMEEIASIIYGKVQKLPDSSLFTVFDRHPEWKNMLVVMDWTASMYTNRATIMNWYRYKADPDAIRHLVFFNDGNWTPHYAKKIGKTGGIYHSRPYDFDHVLRLMYKVRKNGLGGDPAENDMEVLLVSARNLRSYDDIIFLPDRNTSIRDLKLVTRMKKPVRIILFKNKLVRQQGVGRNSGKWTRSNYIHPHYLTVASFTKGSIHTDRKDIYNLHELEAGERIRYGEFTYQKQQNGSFRVIRR